jgi:uncharacterized membrane protein HdeD (DUF308 family)
MSTPEPAPTPETSADAPAAPPAPVPPTADPLAGGVGSVGGPPVATATTAPAPPPAAPAGAAAAGATPPAGPFASAAAPPDPRVVARGMAAHAAALWWVFLITGALWIVAGIVVLQLDARSVFVVGYAVAGILFAMGVEEVLVASAVERLKWLRYGLGIFFLIGGLYALFNPAWTTISLAASLGFLFALLGIFWILEAVAERDGSKAWLLGLAAGIIMLVLSVWVALQYSWTKLVTLLVFAGVWAVLHGVVDIVRAFQLKRLKGELTAGA